MTLNDTLREYCDGLNKKGLLRTRLVTKTNQPDVIHFDSNDYLSLSEDKRISSAYQEGYRHFPSGSGASMLLSGYHENHRAVEQAFADFLAVDECVLFSSGYAANLAISALLGKLKAHCFIDKGVHASIYDGLTLSKVPYTRYLHNDMDDLHHQLHPVTSESAVFTEGIFSMSGQISPLDRISSLGAVLFVDEAHSIGVLGTQGRGAVDFHQLTQREVPLRTIALGKAFAGQGALIAGQKEWIHALLQSGRSLIYSTAVSPALSYGLLKTLDIVAAEDERRIHLMTLIKQFRDHVAMSPFNWSNSETPIQQLQLGCPHLALQYSQAMKKLGFACSVIRAPTVPSKLSGLRIILNFKHNSDHIDLLFKGLNSLYEHTSN